MPASPKPRVSSSTHLKFEVLQDGVDVHVAVEARARHAVAVRAEPDAGDGAERVREGVHHAERVFHACAKWSAFSKVTNFCVFCIWYV